jgi:hypothetical protein
MTNHLAPAVAGDRNAEPVTARARTTRAERMSQPLARDVVRTVAVEHGACIRPVQLRRISTATGERELVLVPCGATLATVCPSCAERAKALRAQQCREGWHLEDEPAPAPGLPDEHQKLLIARLADLRAERDRCEAGGREAGDLDELIEAVEDELAATGVRGHADPGSSSSTGGLGRRHRSTRRRQDAPDLPRRADSAITVGKVYRAPDGRKYRPSMFITLTCPSYGAVRDDGTPVDPDAYDYQGAARDALHFAALFDRFIQNLRRFAGFDVQYFAVIEPQRRLAPHVHLAVRGTISRNDLRKVLAATYHQVWWPATNAVWFDGSCLPVWHESSGRYLDPATGEFLPSWDEALNAISAGDQPRHVARFGAKFDAQGVLAGSKDAARCIGYLTKYLTKQLGQCHEAGTGPQQLHAGRLIAALEYEPCSSTCANWLRYGITPKNPRPGLVPGYCKGKAHRPQHLGYAGRRVLVSRSWSGKTLADHRRDRQAWLLETLGLPATDPSTYRWEPVQPGDIDYLLLPRRLLHALVDRLQWQRMLDEARHRARDDLTTQLSATGRAA